MLKDLWAITKAAAKDWQQDNAMRLSAALAYYSVFSLAPILLVAISVAGFIFGEDAARGAIEQQLTGSIGQDSAAAIQEMVDSARKGGNNALMGFVGGIVLLFSASGVFAQLKEAMNLVWEIEPKKDRAIWMLIRTRFLSLSMVLAIGFLLLTSLVLSTALAATVSWLGAVLPIHPFLIQALGFILSLGIVTLLFALIFKVLPDAKIEWRDVWTGAFVTACLFSIGKFFLALYLSREATASTYGAAGALVLILVWVYYTTNLLLFGAELTQANARFHGREILPAPGAKKSQKIQADFPEEALE
ncbi:YihY/virulence factor BrkB family protein [bacterium]|nr:YihY/virulence factor BrkB family protein [bacterium]